MGAREIDIIVITIIAAGKEDSIYLSPKIPPRITGIEASVANPMGR